jgi:hypothetical protein
MRADRKPFMPVSNDVDDDRLEQLAREKGVGKLETPVRIDSRAGEGAAQVHPPALTSTIVQYADAATPRSKMKKVNFELPDYVWTELKIRAAHKQSSVRHVLMEALQTEGFTIHEIDMVEDGRRLRGKVH